MFTGLIEEKGIFLGKKQNAGAFELTIGGNVILQDVRLGDSIAVNGICLTVKDFTAHTFSADVMGESLRRTNLGLLKQGQGVNLERAMQAGDRFGGHMVTGHVDGTGKLLQKKREGNAVWFQIETPAKLKDMIVEKGSVALDGISLTIAKVFPASFWVSVIPHTLQETNLGERRMGDLLNVEGDVLGKYVKNQMQQRTGITKEFLQKHGFL